MYTELRRDRGSKLPIVMQPEAGVVLTVWSDTSNRVTATIHEHEDGSLSFRLETYDRNSKTVGLHVYGKVPTTTSIVAPEATSDDGEASAQQGGDDAIVGG